MLNQLFPPLCLLLALTMLIVSFSMIAFGGPEASIELHQARASGDDTAVDVLEADLGQKQTSRVVLIVCLLLGSGVMTVLAFSSMRGPSPPPVT